MSFLAPLFLLGGLAIGLPVLFHFIRRSTRERTTFSSLMFLTPSPPRLSKRSRLEHLLLLALRCLAILLLAFGFARPFFKHHLPQLPQKQAAKTLVLLLDASASMRRQDLWEQGRKQAVAALRQAGPADRVALYTFDTRLRPLMSLDQWSALPIEQRVSTALGQLAQAKPGWGATRLDQALIQAAEILEQADKNSGDSTRQILVFSDFQEGSQTTALQGHEWPKNVEVIAEPLKLKPESNAGLQLVSEPSDAPLTRDPLVRARVSNAADSKREQFRVGWSTGDGKLLEPSVSVYVPPGQNRLLALATPTNAAVDRLMLLGDDESFDNTVFVIPAQPANLSILYVGNDVKTDNRQPLFYLSRAFQNTKGQAIHVQTIPAAAAPPSPQLSNAALLVATDTINDMQAAALRSAVELGKTLFFAPVGSESARSLAKLLAQPLPVEEGPTNSYAMLGQIDFRHPLFAPFADARFSDFTKIHFWRHRRFDLSALSNARVIAHFDDGDPALMELELGKGRIFILASGWHPADSQLALSSKFVPLLYSLLDISGASVPALTQYFVGQSVTRKALSTDRNSVTSVRLPTGDEAEWPKSAEQFDRLDSPGIYMAGIGAGGSASTTTSAAERTRPRRFAVNLDPLESRTVPLAIDELDKLGVPRPAPKPLTRTTLERQVSLQSAEAESQQKLWRWFIFATLALLLVETWLAGRTARRALPVEAAP